MTGPPVALRRRPTPTAIVVAELGCGGSRFDREPRDGGQGKVCAPRTVFPTNSTPYTLLKIASWTVYKSHPASPPLPSRTPRDFKLTLDMTAAADAVATTEQNSSCVGEEDDDDDYDGAGKKRCAATAVTNDGRVGKGRRRRCGTTTLQQRRTRAREVLVATTIRWRRLPGEHFSDETDKTRDFRVLLRSFEIEIFSSSTGTENRTRVRLGRRISFSKQNDLACRKKANK